MKTKQRILHAATQLFNDSGTSKISTNNIDASLSISPGNLYYHFKNKSEIIRAILEKMYEQWNQVWNLPEGVRLDKQILRQRLLMNFQLLWSYRFFYREALALFQTDEGLRQQH